MFYTVTMKIRLSMIFIHSPYCPLDNQVTGTPSGCSFSLFLQLLMVQTREATMLLQTKQLLIFLNGEVRVHRIIPYRLKETPVSH